MASKNQMLKKLYDQIYRRGKDKFFTFNSNYVTKEVLRTVEFAGKRVLEIGCGTGVTALAIAKAGGKILAIDYSKEVIKIATREKKHKNLEFKSAEPKNIKEMFDIIVMQDVIEHLDEPLKQLRDIKKKLNAKGKIIITCPSFMNVRGYVWMTLLKLFNVPMSLTDINFLSPFDFIEWAKKLNMKLTWRTFNFNLGNNQKMVIDMRKRLTNALRDAKMKADIPALLTWLKKVSRFDHKQYFSGAKGIYLLEKK
jgi:SAM-dependent methyltransferase